MPSTLRQSTSFMSKWPISCGFRLSLDPSHATRPNFLTVSVKELISAPIHTYFSGATMRVSYFVFAVACFFSVSVASAQVTIGNGFTCEGTSIFKGTREVKYSKARSTLTETIERLKTRLETAPKKKKPGLRAQLADARSTKTNLQSCSKGTLAPSEVDPIFTQLSGGTGIYSGTYNGVVGGIQPISGPVQLVFELEGTVFGTTLTLGGNLGSALKAEPLTFQSDVGGIGFPAQFFLTGTTLGDVTLSITQTGHLTITNSNSPKATVTFEGDFGDNTITSTLSGTYSGFPFTGGASLTRQQ